MGRYDIILNKRPQSKPKEKLYCQNPECENEIAEPIMCCSGHECGCMGLPIEPPVCSTECQTECLKTLLNKEENDDCNDPVLCTNCDRQSEWPNCMKDVKLRGYHSIFMDKNFDDVVECSNHTPLP